MVDAGKQTQNLFTYAIWCSSNKQHKLHRLHMYLLVLADWLSQGGTTIFIETNKHAFILSPPPPQNLKVATLIKGKKNTSRRLRPSAAIACVRVHRRDQTHRSTKQKCGWLASTPAGTARNTNSGSGPTPPLGRAGCGRGAATSHPRPWGRGAQAQPGHVRCQG